MTKPSHNRTFAVTSHDIANGIARDSEFCPLAEVLQRSLPNARYILVDLATIRWSDPVKRKRYVFSTPKIAKQFIVDFDRGYHDRLKPFTLSLQSPIQIVEMRAHRERDRSQEYANRKARKKAAVIMHGLAATKIGGRLPPTVPDNHGNIVRTRKFGTRALIE